MMLADQISVPAAERKMKVFKAKHGEVSRLESYDEPPPPQWWKKFPKVSWEEGKQIRSTINPTMLFNLANKINYPDMATVLEIVQDVMKI